MMTCSGPLLFARYAYPPNALGYCGPSDSSALLDYMSRGASDPGLVDLARRFEGAWPYLALIAAASGRVDPLDPQVVEAYWIGNQLLETISPSLLAVHLESRFQPQLGGAGFADLAVLASVGGRAHHNFHVFAVYPWVRMLRKGKAREPLDVLDACRIRWGRVTRVVDCSAEILSRPLCWAAGRLTLGLPRAEVVRLCKGLDANTGDWVSAHWDWACETITVSQVSRLADHTALVIALVNSSPGRPVMTAAAS